MSKIDQLSIQTICANSESLKSCQQLILKARNNIVDNSFKTNNCIDSTDSNNLPYSAFQFAAKKTFVELQDIKGALSKQHVNSIEDFYHHTQLHRKRVKALALELYKMYPEKFSGLSEDQVKLAMTEHDRAKISGLAMADDKEQFYKKLYSGYQRRIDRSTIDRLNKIDQKYMDRAFEVIGLKETPNMSKEYKKELKEKRKAMKLIETIADFVDRGMSPVSEEEFGRKMDLASDFLKKPEERKMAAALEKRYSRVVQGLEYSAPNVHQVRAIKFSMMLDSKKENLKLKYDSKIVSAKTLLQKATVSSKKTTTQILQALASKSALRALAVVDGVGLYFSDMNNIGCTQTPGQHDWQKVDGICKPVIDLTPGFVEFLNLDEAQQEHYLKNDIYTCRVLNEVFEKSKIAPKLDQCSEKSMVMNSNNVRMKVNYNANGNINSIELLDYSSFLHSIVNGVPEKAMFNEKGEIREVCYLSGSFSNKNYDCVNEKDNPDYQNNLKKTRNLIQSASFEINKARYCCQKQLNPNIEKSTVDISCQ